MHSGLVSFVGLWHLEAMVPLTAKASLLREITLSNGALAAEQVISFGGSLQQYLVSQQGNFPHSFISFVL